MLVKFPTMLRSNGPRQGTSSDPRGWRLLVLTVTLMVAFYAALFHPYPEASLPGRMLSAYLKLTARGSGALLGWFGEPVSVEGATVLGRFPFVVVLDCAALDAQALYAAAVLAFPAPPARKLIGLVGGLTGIWAINVLRLVTLYHAGVHSRELFNVLHEELMVMLVILSVCGLFVVWAWWSRRQSARALPLAIEHAG